MRVTLGDDPRETARALGAKLGAEIRAEAGEKYRAHFGDNGW
jgi:hypothetical protein